MDPDEQSAVTATLEKGTAPHPQRPACAPDLGKKGGRGELTRMPHKSLSMKWRELLGLTSYWPKISHTV